MEAGEKKEKGQRTEKSREKPPVVAEPYLRSP